MRCVFDVFFIFQIKHNPDPFDVNVCGGGGGDAKKEVLVDYAQGTVKVFFDAKGPCPPEGNYLSMQLLHLLRENEKYLQSFFFPHFFHFHRR